MFWEPPRFGLLSGTAEHRHNDDTKSSGRAASQNQIVNRRNFGKGAQMWQKLRIREIDAATAAAEESYLRFLHPNFPLNKGEVSRDYRRGKKNEWMVKARELCSSFRSMMILITLLWAYKLQKLTFNDLTSGGIEFLSAELLSYLNQINFPFG